MSVTKALIVNNNIYSRLLANFPQNFTFCFAYGSGVKQQTANVKQSNMIDLIYCVNNPKKWHQYNLKTNSSHYSGLKYFGHNFIATFQENSGAKVYFNTLVPVEGVMIKYGVTSTRDLVNDLLDWSDLYLAGRLHKPVEIIHEVESAELKTALQLNLQSAVHAALLLLPDTFTEYEFYYAISNLSYAGDFRMTFGENKNKVENIVKPQFESFRKLYRPLLGTLNDYIKFPEIGVESASCAQDTHPLAKLHHLNQLPRGPQKALTRVWNRGGYKQDTEDVLRAVAHDPDCNAIVGQCISDIVWKSSIRQSLKGILTAGFVKSFKYSSRKIMKMLN